MIRIHPIILAVLSAVLLILSFPKLNLPLSWIGLVPLMFLLDRPVKRFGWAYLTGVLFFAATLYWFVFVTPVGAFFFILYLALYFGLFGLLYNWFRNESIFRKMIVLPSGWVALEFTRGNFLSGFGWVSLGHSQYQNWPLIQIADLTGVYGVSFLVVLVNVLIKENVQVLRTGAEGRSSLIKANMLGAGILTLALAYGFLKAPLVTGLPTVPIAVIQANVAQEDKWVPENRPGIVAKQLDLTRRAAEAHPALIIWPETSYPGFIDEDPELMGQIKLFSMSKKIPVLIGVMREVKGQYFNSAALIGPDGKFALQYDKLHLVPFGEFLPLRKYWGPLAQFIPIEDFTSGNAYPLFPGKLSGPDLPRFSVLICFEDTIPYVARNFVAEGSQLLVNITNDAWFRDTKAPYLHLQAAIFRSVENKRSLVRSANTGISGFIDPLGRVIELLTDDAGKPTYVEGFAVSEVPISGISTFYTKYGDIFTYICFLCILWGIIGQRIGKKSGS